MTTAPPDDAAARWNHNIHLQPVVTGAVPPGCDRVLDVGCGEGTVTRALTLRARHVTGLDPHAPSIGLARSQPVPDNVDYVVGDILDPPFEPGSFDATVAVAVLHHMDCPAP
ncbi:MAG TPA: class I SAM-dependent methyltransferase [Acidimicrobiales bacterium]|nr:class I SAM-dependent methyltransferase [Acidimicrobiales bacterium]